MGTYEMMEDIYNEMIDNDILPSLQFVELLERLSTLVDFDLKSEDVNHYDPTLWDRIDEELADL